MLLVFWEDSYWAYWTGKVGAGGSEPFLGVAFIDIGLKSAIGDRIFLRQLFFSLFIF